MKAVKIIVEILFKFGIAAGVLLAAASVTLYLTRKQYTVPLTYTTVSEHQLVSEQEKIDEVNQELTQARENLAREKEAESCIEAEEALYLEAMEEGNVDSEDVIQGIVETCHVENEEYQLITKEIIMGCFGYEIPEIDYSDTSNENIRKSLKEFALNVCTAEMVNDDERSLAQAAIEGAWNAEDNKLEAAWDATVDQGIEILKGKIKDKSMDFLGEKFNGVLDRVTSVAEGIEGFYTAATEDGSSSDVKYLEKDMVAKIEQELNLLLEYMEKENYTASEMAELLYLFHQYGTDIDELNRIAGYEVVSCDWTADYEFLEEVGRNYQKNAELLKLLDEQKNTDEER